MVAVLSRMFGLSQIDRVMDVVQDTFETALLKWPYSGIPDNPPAWLMQVAKNKAINTFKRDQKTQSFSSSVYLRHFESGFENQFNILLSPAEIKDSQLRLLFTCCQPDFSAKNQIILTLHILCGFGIPEIANALLMNEEAVKKALSRTKQVLQKLDSILQTSIITQSNERFETVQTILYLMFNEGYKTTRSKKAINNDLCFEAIRLTKLLENNNAALNGKTNALLALMFFNIARFPARRCNEGEWLSLEEQNRTLWDKLFIEEGFYYLNKSTIQNKLSRYHLEAMIASLHCSAPGFNETDWKKISFLYQQLEVMEPHSPLIKLNRIIAESYLDLSNSITELNKISHDAFFKNNFLFPASKADILKRMGQIKQAQQAYSEALQLAISPIDKKFLQKKIMQCELTMNKN